MPTPLGTKLTAETKAKMSAAHLGKRHTEESKKKMSESNRGKTVSKEHMDKLQEGRARFAAQGLLKCRPGCTCGRHRSWTDEERLRKSLSMIGRDIGKVYGPPSDEQREKNRQAQLANKNNKRSKGYKHTDEWKQKNSERTKKRWLDGVYDHKHPAWGKSGVHADVKMKCLNSEGGFARDLDSQGISWFYEPKRFKLSWCSYTPDFYLPEFDIWVEVKGYPELPGNWEKKVDTFRKETGKTIIVVFMKELSSPKYGVGE